MIVQRKRQLQANLSRAQHNASSPLLRLPLEVKNLIYEFTFGGNVIHITQDPDEGTTKFFNTICHALISEEEAEDNFNEETIHEWCVPANEDRHSCCRLKKRANIDNGEERPQTLRLSALRCCRQMYNEAHYVPYSTNTFSCVDPVTLQMFIRSLTQGSHENHLAVRSLFLEMVFVRYYHSRWRKTLKTCAKHLKNLKNVNISLEWNCRFWIYGGGSPANFDVNSRNWQTPVISDILVLKQLPLESATLVISDDYLRWPQRTSLGGSARWTLEEKQEWARYTKDLILK